MKHFKRITNNMRQCWQTAISQTFKRKTLNSDHSHWFLFFIEKGYSVDFNWFYLALLRDKVITYHFDY